VSDALVTDGEPPRGEYAWHINSFAVAAGRPISDDDLKYWREQGAIPKPRIVPHPEGRGRTGLYPAGTAEQAVTLAHLLDEGCSIADAAWALWLKGYDVGVRWTRDRIIATAKMLDAQIEQIGRDAFIGDSKEAFADEVLDWLDSNPRLYDPTLRKTRKLTGSKRFGTFVLRMLRLATGGAIPLAGPAQVSAEDTAYDQRTVIDGLGLARLPIDGLPGVPATPARDILTAINKVALRLQRTVLAAPVSQMREAELKQAALEVEAVRSNSRALFAALSWLFGRHAFGRGHVVRTLEHYSNADFVVLTTMWAVVRGDFIEGAHAEVALAKAGTVGKLVELSERFQALLRDNPALAAIWTPTAIREAWRSSKTHAEHAEKLRRLVARKLIQIISLRAEQVSRDR
jgi:hypothetical protein